MVNKNIIRKEGNMKIKNEDYKIEPKPLKF